VAVSLAVVVPAEELQVFEIGRAAVFPVFDVVRVAVIGGTVASRGLAVTVADDECFPLGGAHGAGSPTHVEDLRAAGDE
jgi:hypothetical protein